jgi:hypothetical protein
MNTWPDDRRQTFIEARQESNATYATSRNRKLWPGKSEAPKAQLAKRCHAKEQSMFARSSGEPQAVWLAFAR